MFANVLTYRRRYCPISYMSWRQLSPVSCFRWRPHLYLYVYIVITFVVCWRCSFIYIRVVHRNYFRVTEPNRKKSHIYMNLLYSKMVSAVPKQIIMCLLRKRWWFLCISNTLSFYGKKRKLSILFSFNEIYLLS